MNDKKSKDEVVDGPAAAARILSHMDGANREKILREIARIDPEILGKIQDNLSSFEDVVELTPQSLQLLIQKIDHNDLVLSLKVASNESKEALFKNMSKGKKRQVEDDFASLPSVRLSEVEAAQRRILAILEDLRAQGLIRSKAKNDLYV